MSRSSDIAVCAALALALGGCFTGIESTPRITASDVHRQRADSTAEQRMGARISGEPPCSWRPGKQWLADDDRASRMFDGTSTARTDSLAGHMLTLAGTPAYATMTGAQAVAYTFTADDRPGLLVYRTDIPEADIGRYGEMTLPYMVEISAARVADSLLRGRRVFVTSPLWTDSAGRAVDGLHHVGAVIDSVSPGRWTHPLQVAFHVDGDTAAHYLYMTHGTGAAARRNFDRLFSFTDPRRAYPQVSAEHWPLITHSRVCEGMGRDECHLALGAPASVDRGYTQSSSVERWSYANGAFLIFEDGILIRYRQ